MYIPIIYILIYIKYKHYSPVSTEILIFTLFQINSHVHAYYFDTNENAYRYNYKKIIQLEILY